ncbi:aspartyl-phosphate phosphatase Spo0E family protein [Metabacillus arenae]|uniref:Aspartyl-phosphate phosphatase Spo0E family protein n=1 Tax=Metabacillus arenae TaxID=2771434 RepID=A0A926NPT2_9BACI|nr:aspartyl-phosphate phosphatase Spo0E family protein [Metabacillus arenae]MBD1381711.1 aspartyl-phosphate phosphatase Spo0E family protein [Metabacillus arenae]
MILEDVIALKKCIDEYRQSMYQLAKKKGISDPNVIQISQQLDRKIIVLQKIICDF